MRAYNRHDEAGFLATMDYFYSVAGTDIRARRKKLAGYIDVSESDLEFISTDGASTVTFCERGLFDYEGGRGRVRHGKAIVMRKVDAEARIGIFKEFLQKADDTERAPGGWYSRPQAQTASPSLAQHLCTDMKFPHKAKNGIEWGSG